MTDTSVLFAAAQALHRSGRLAEARDRYVRVLAEAPRHGGALHMLGPVSYTHLTLPTILRV